MPSDLERRGSPRAISLAAGLVGLLAAACGGGDEASRLNVLLVVIDTVRADKLGIHGGPEGLTPRLDRLAAEGARFERAAAHAPWTLPSTASLLTSRLPEEHGAGGFLDLSPLAEGRPPSVAFRGLDEGARTLAEVFREGGWRTGSVVNVDFLDQGFGLTQGVEDVDARWYTTNSEVRSAAETTTQALAWLGERERASEPFFLLAHYFDAHAVYDPPAEFRERFADPRDRAASGLVFGTREHMLLLRSGRLTLDPSVLGRAERLYEAELAALDAELGRLLDGLDALGLAEDTVVVLTADHGEEFLDHGGFEHGHTLYDELLRVPLLVRLPGVVPEGQVIHAPVGLVDVAPTLCELAGLEVPSSFGGRSLVPALAGGPLAARAHLAHGNFWGPPLTSWTSGDLKLIVTPAHDGSPERVELYDLSSDPAEATDLAADRPGDTRRLREELEAVRAHLVRGSGGAPVELDEATRSRLEALGYLGSGDDG